MQMTLPMIELALPVTVSKAELRHILKISDKTLRKRYLTDEFYLEAGTCYESEKNANDLSINLTSHFFYKYPEIKRAFYLRFLQNPGIPRNILELVLQTR